MRLRLKEDPREWRKFLAVAVVFGGLAATLAWRRGWLTGAGCARIALLLVVVGVAGALQPRWVRPVYRLAMTMSHHVGGVMGRVLLFALFVLVVTPLGWVLRLMGRDLLERRLDPGAATYWRPPTRSGSLDRMY